MRNCLWKKGLVVGIILLFVGTGVCESEIINMQLGPNSIEKQHEKQNEQSYLRSQSKTICRSKNDDALGVKKSSSSSSPPINGPKWNYVTGGAVQNVAISLNGEYIVAGSGNIVYLFQRNNSNPKWSKELGYPIDSVSISGAGEYIAVGSHVQKVGYVTLLNNIGTRVFDDTYEAGTRDYFDTVQVALSGDGEFFVAGTALSTTLDTSYGYVYCYHIGQTINLNWSCLSDSVVSISIGGEYIAVGATFFGHILSSEVSLFHKDMGFLWTNHSNSNSRYSVSLSDDGEFLAVGNWADAPYQVRCFQKDNNTPLWSFVSTKPIYSISISGDGQYIAAGSDQVLIFTKDNDTPLWSYNLGSSVTSLSFSQYEYYLVVGTLDGKTYFFNKAKDTPLWTYDTIYKPPNKPVTPSGETRGKTGEKYTYDSWTTDPNGDKIYYWFDWGDGTNSGWVGPFNNGATASAQHRWSKQGTYQIKVKAKDPLGLESEWSDNLPVSMPCNLLTMMLNRPVDNLLFQLIQMLKHLFSLFFLKDRCSAQLNPDSYPLSLLGDRINSVSISANGRFATAGCNDKNVYFFWSWDEVNDEILDNNTYVNKIPCVYAIIHDPNGDSSYAELKKETTNTIGFSKSLEVGTDVQIEAKGAWFGTGPGYCQDIEMTHTLYNEVWVSYTLSHSVTSQQLQDKDSIGPGHGDVYWIEEWVIPYQLANRSLKLRGETIFSIPVFLFGIKRQNTVLVSADTIAKNNYLGEPWRSFLLNMDIGYDNHINGSESPLVVPLDNPVYFESGSSYDYLKSITKYTSRTLSFDFSIKEIAAESLGFDFEETGISGMVNISISMKFGATMFSNCQGSDSNHFILYDGTSYGDDGKDGITIAYYEDTTFGTILFITDENASTTSGPHEHWTQKADTIAPTVDINQPSDGQQVQGTVWVVVTATDNDPNKFYQIFIDGAEKFNTTTQDDYIEWPWDTTQYPNGSHVLKTLVTDSSGNTGEHDHTVIVNN